MQIHTHACIAYIVGRFISGKRVDSLYDYSRARKIDMKSIPGAERLRDFNYANWSYMSGPSRSTRLQFSCVNGMSLELRIKGNTFIGFIRENSSHFIGNIRGNTVNIYDQQQAAHFSYRLSGRAVEH
ncbi:MAG: hypothetical protein HZA17_03200 [Nitrospirae bacterium]|nr:hypothetical protein [Nitrospirota bacterium]